MDTQLLWLIPIAIGTFIVTTLIWSVGGPWLPTSRANVRRMLKMAGLQPGETLYDLGCGDGRVLVIAAKEFGAKSIGIEIDKLRYFWTKLVIKLSRVEDKTEIILANFFKQDLSQADVVISFLLQKTQNKLVHKLSKELKPGTRIVANAFIFPGWEVVEKDEKNQLYLYKIP